MQASAEVVASGVAQAVSGDASVQASVEVPASGGSQAVPGAASVHASDQTLVVGDSVLFGDLSEFGVGLADAVSASGPRPHPHGNPLAVSSGPADGFLQSFRVRMDGVPLKVQLKIWCGLGYRDEDYFRSDHMETED